MKKYIVTTTIQAPTEATLKFAKMKGWDFIIVGDQKTPHALYEGMDIIYLTPEYQEKQYKALSDAIGWNCIMRRNLGFVEAFRRGADVIASVDDDNIPYADWGKNLLVGKAVEVDYWVNDNGNAFDPLSITNHNYLWHRGFPLNEITTSRRPRLEEEDTPTIVHIEVGLWDGDPDIDAICRIMYNPKHLTLHAPLRYSSTQFIPFNSQNTFLSREAIQKYMVLPFVGRMDDIWGGYILQNRFPNSLIFNRASVYQARNEQDLIKNLENETIGYRNTLNFVKGKASLDLPFVSEETRNFYKTYRSMF